MPAKKIDPNFSQQAEIFTYYQEKNYVKTKPQNSLSLRTLSCEIWVQTSLKENRSELRTFISGGLFKH